MALSKSAVKNTIKTVLDANMSNTNAANSRDAFAEALATAICDAVKAAIESATTANPSGLIAPAGTSGGPVTGQLSQTLTISE